MEHVPGVSEEMGMARMDADLLTSVRKCLHVSMEQCVWISWKATSAKNAPRDFVGKESEGMISTIVMH